jgi:hypothetical protein
LKNACEYELILSKLNIQVIWCEICFCNMITRKYEILIHFYTKRWHMQIDDTKLKNVQDPKDKNKNI